MLLSRLLNRFKGVASLFLSHVDPNRKARMKEPMILMALLLPFLGGCESYTWLVYENPSLSGAKEGRECLSPDAVGLGRTVDLSGHEAMRLGDITKVRRIEYQVTKLHGFGKECIVAHGE